MLHRMILWADGVPTPLLRAQWNRLGAAQPLRPVAYLEQDRSATREFRGLWQRAFADRRALPFGPLATKEGKGTDAFLDILSEA
jgi:hypothetical protein